MSIVDNISTAHTSGDGRVDDDSADEVADIGSLATGEIDTDTEVTHLLQKLLCTIDDSTDNLAGDEILVAADGRREKDVVDGADTEEVVEIHDNSIDGNTLPDGEVAGLFPIEIGQRRLGAGTVGVHDIAVKRVAGEEVGDYFAESLREEALIDIFDSVVDVFLRGRDTAEIVFFHHVLIEEYVVKIDSYEE